MDLPLENNVIIVTGSAKEVENGVVKNVLRVEDAIPVVNMFTRIERGQMRKRNFKNSFRVA